MTRTVDPPQAPAPQSSRRPVRPARWRNIVIFVAGVWLLALLSWVVSTATADEAEGPAAEQSPAMLLFILGPILMASALRWWGGDRWGDAGLRLRLRGNFRWYALSLLLFPALAAVSVGVGAAVGRVEFAPGAPAAFATLLASTLVVRMIFALCEEWGWRGYLEPRLSRLGVTGLRRHGLVAVVWGLWHVPYLAVVGTLSDLPMAVYLPLFLVAMLPMAVIYGVVRERTDSVWPAVLMHGVANAVAFPLLSTEVVTRTEELWFAARPEGLVTLAGLALTAVLLYRRARPAS